MPPRLLITSNALIRKSTLIPCAGGHLYTEQLSTAASQSSPHLILLRGWGRSVRHWLGFDERLAQYFRVLTLDARGIGRSTAKVDWNLSTEILAADVCLCMDHLQIPSAHILGVSLGGMIALRMGQLYPHRLRSIIAVNASFKGSFSPRLTPKALRTIVGGVIDKERFPELLSYSLLSPQTSSTTRNAIAKEWEAIEKIEKLSIAVAIKQLLAASRFAHHRHLRQITTPTLLVYGTDDSFVSHHNTRKLAKLIPGSRLQPLTGAGHEPSLDRPEEFTSLIRQYVAEQEQHLSMPENEEFASK